ncbi:MAG: alpha/beta hydrolase [Lachnospiraceae bacterium]|nr:alpha/beta hydrolase [Lachnospiraceae bacterium]
MRYEHTETENVSCSLICVGRDSLAVLYENRTKEKRKGIGVAVMHSDSNYMTFSAGTELAERGFTVMCASVHSSQPLMMKMMTVKGMVEHLRSLPGIEKVFLFGHSGGATLMSGYQNVAENGASVFQKPGLIVQFPDKIPGPPGFGVAKLDLIPADGVMLIDPNWGNAVMCMFGLDGALMEEGNPDSIDPELDMFNPKNGFDPEGCHYSEEFLRKYQNAQGERMNRLIAYALDRETLIRAGKGFYEDEEPFLITGGGNSFFNNRLFAQDTTLFSSTKKEYLLLKKDGQTSMEIIKTVRKPYNWRSMTRNYREGMLRTTISGFLDSWCVRTDHMYYDATSVYGVDWDSSYSTSTGNIKGVKAPLLLMGMTGGCEFACVEGIAERATSDDVTIAFVEGATHMYCPDRGNEEKYGDTLKTTYDYVGKWMEKQLEDNNI